MLFRPQHGAFTDPVIRALSQLGINARLRPPGRAEEFAGPAVGGNSTGIIEVDSWPVRWVNVQASVPAAPGREDWFMLLYGIPDERITAGFEDIEVKARIDGNGPATAVSWQAKTGWRKRRNESFSHAIADRLNGNGALNMRLARTRVQLAIVADPVVDSWIIAPPSARRLERALPSRDLLDVLQLIGTSLLEQEVPGDLRAIRLSDRGRNLSRPAPNHVVNANLPLPRREERPGKRKVDTRSLAERAQELPTRVQSGQSRDLRTREWTDTERYAGATSLRDRSRQPRAEPEMDNIGLKVFAGASILTIVVLLLLFM